MLRLSWQYYQAVLCPTLAKLNFYIEYTISFFVGKHYNHLYMHGAEPEYFIAKVIVQNYPHLLPESITLICFTPLGNFHPFLQFSPLLGKHNPIHTLRQNYCSIFFAIEYVFEPLWNHRESVS